MQGVRFEGVQNEYNYDTRYTRCTEYTKTIQQIKLNV